MGPTHRAPTGARLRRAARAAAVAGLLVLLAGLPLSGPFADATARGSAYGYATPVPSVAPHNVTFNVTMTDAPSFVPANLTGAAAGASVTVNLHNAGSYPHTFTVARVANFVLPRSWSPVQVMAWFQANGSLANVSVAPGASAAASFALPANSTGASFEYVSVVAYQFQAGMAGFLAVNAGPGVSLSDTTSNSLRFIPSVLVVNATQFPVTIDVRITGDAGHTWTVSAIPNVYANNGNLSAYYAAHARANVAVNGPGPYWANFTLTQRGAYQFVCLIPGHFAGGMNGTLYVGALPPAPPPALSGALVAAWVLALGGGLLGLAILLTIAATWAGRFPRRAAGRH